MVPGVEDEDGRYYRWAQRYYRSPGVSSADPVNVQEMG
jgi:hypothetical protein